MLVSIMLGVAGGGGGGSALWSLVQGFAGFIAVQEPSVCLECLIYLTFELVNFHPAPLALISLSHPHW